VIHKLLIKLVMLALFLSPLATAQSSRGGAGASDGGRTAPETPEQPPFRQPGQAVPGNNLAPPQLDADPAVSRRQALNLAQDRFQGRVLSVRMIGSDWRIRVDQNGTVFNVFVDGSTGEVSRSAD
tara:strand:- start:732 stop:1106 length:375 start_codon:yes stop_codon:yes gene_type:complete